MCSFGRTGEFTWFWFELTCGPCWSSSRSSPAISLCESMLEWMAFILAFLSLPRFDRDLWPSDWCFFTTLVVVLLVLLFFSPILSRASASLAVNLCWSVHQMWGGLFLSRTCTYAHENSSKKKKLTFLRLHTSTLFLFVSAEATQCGARFLF